MPALAEWGADPEPPEVPASTVEHDAGRVTSPAAIWSESAGSAAAAPREGMPGRGAAISGTAAVAACVALDFALTGSLTFFFDLCFIVVSLSTALVVRRRDIFVVALLAPIQFCLVIGVVATFSPGAFPAADSASSTFLTGLAQHAFGLVAGYGAALLTLLIRVTRPTRSAPHSPRR